MVLSSVYKKLLCGGEHPKRGGAFVASRYRASEAGKIRVKGLNLALLW